MYHVPLTLQCVHNDAVMKEMKMRMERMRVRSLEEGGEWRLTGLLYAYELILSGELEEELNVFLR